MIAKGPNYRDQNNINWNVNSKICKEAVSKYKVKWSKKVKVDRRMLNEWEITVHGCIDRRIQQLRPKHINKHVFKDKLQLDYLQDLHNKFVLVPTDKAVNSVIVVRKKYYLKMVLDQFNATHTYFKDSAKVFHVSSTLMPFLFMYSHVLNYMCNVNCFWIINNSQQAKCFDRFDFSTLYTSITQVSLMLTTLIQEAYRVEIAYT